jgi:hypothetical protein
VARRRFGSQAMLEQIVDVSGLSSFSAFHSPAATEGF